MVSDSSDASGLAKQFDNEKVWAHTMVDLKDPKKRGPLHFAAWEGNIEMCKYLIDELNLDINTKDRDGETPLIYAACQGHADIAMYLVEHGGDPAIPSESGSTALHHAAGIGNTKLLRFLLSKGVDVELQSDIGSPLIWAVVHDQQDAVRLLLDHNANPNNQNNYNITPLVSAVCTDSLSCLELLLQAGAILDVNDGATPLLNIAADFGSVKIINCLLKAGADPNATDEDGMKPIQVASARGNKEAYEILQVVTNVFKWNGYGLVKKKQVLPWEKKRASKEMAMGNDAFRKKDYFTAIHCYTQAINLNPNDAALYSNRSVTWICLLHGENALADAKASREIRPDSVKACYHEGEALLLMQRFEDAAEAFYKGLTLDPNNKKIKAAYRKVVKLAQAENPMAKSFVVV